MLLIVVIGFPEGVQQPPTVGQRLDFCSIKLRIVEVVRVSVANLCRLCVVRSAAARRNQNGSSADSIVDGFPVKYQSQWDKDKLSE